MDIFCIDGLPALRAICQGGRFSATSFLTSISAENAWQTFKKIWLNACAGAPHILCIDQGKQFAPKGFASFCDSLGMLIHEMPIESPNSLSLCERYHDPIRRIFKKARASANIASRSELLSDAAKATNDALGPEGYAPACSLLACFQDSQSEI